MAATTIEFQAIAWHGEDIDLDRPTDDDDEVEATSEETADDDGGDESSSMTCSSSAASSADDKNKKKKTAAASTGPPYKTLSYVIKVFGRKQTEPGQDRGDSVAVTIVNFRPFFYVRVDDAFTKDDVDLFVHHVKNNMAQRCFLNVDHCELVERKDMWGFSNFKRFKFIKFHFKSCRFMKYAAKFFLERDIAFKGRRPQRFVVYESNVEPYIRFMHQRAIQPCGWISVVADGAGRPSLLPAKTSIDVTASYRRVSPVLEQRRDAQFLVMSFDLECMSETGDFPVPKKDYTKLAATLHDAVKRWSADESDYDVHAKATALLARSIGAASIIGQDAAIGQELDRIGVPKCVFVRDGRNTSPAALMSLVRLTLDDAIAIVHKRMQQQRKQEDVGEEDPAATAAAGATAKRKVSQEALDDEERSKKIYEISEIFRRHFPKLAGDAIIQIGATFHMHAVKDRDKAGVCERHVFTLDTCDGSFVDETTGDDLLAGTKVVPCKFEQDVITKFAKLVADKDPDIVTGYNIFGFDMRYIEQRAHEVSDQCREAAMVLFNRLAGRAAKFEERSLSSSALGDNKLYMIDMIGRVPIDLMKVAQRDHKLDSYKLDEVAFHFLKERKHDVSPKDIFDFHKNGGSRGRAKVAAYCVQDCELVNKLMLRLNVMENNMGMSNVCYVPMWYIFMRGQGIKIFSLVLNECHKHDTVIPTRKMPKWDAKADGDANPGTYYEGAIVLPPECGVYDSEPVTVLDYASLYPSSMIAENISHDCILLEKHAVNDKVSPAFRSFIGGAYDNLPGVTYTDLKYPYVDPTTRVKDDTGRMEWVRIARVHVKGADGAAVLDENGRPTYVEGVLPQTLRHLLKARKDTRKKIALEQDPDVKKTLDGLQNAYKVTANSLYGQMGASTSQLLLKEVAASTTATGREMILKAKKFIEETFDGHVIYGDTDSVFCKFPPDPAVDPNDRVGKVAAAMRTAREASERFKREVLFDKKPHDLEYDKTFYPFILLSKKRYVGNMYEDSPDEYCQKSMGIVLRRRDNAPIVKDVYGEIIRILLEENDLQKSVAFLREKLDELCRGDCPLEKLIVSKSLRDTYADKTRIAHKVLADRMTERDPGTSPQVGDRVPYVYFVQPTRPPAAAGGGARGRKPPPVLQGERIEHPDYIRANGLVPDYQFYISNQIMKPVAQIYGLVVEKLEGYRRPSNYFDEMAEKYRIKEKDEEKVRDKIVELRESCAEAILFAPSLTKIERKIKGNASIEDFFARISCF